jgi:hypothetical protein
VRTVFAAVIVAVSIASPGTAAKADDALPVRLALQTEAAFGVTPGEFRNHLLGARLDFEFSPRVSFGGYFGYANLKGKDDRVHNVLGYAQVEYLAGYAESWIRFPLRFASGYLPGNGPIARLAAGVALRLSPRAYLVAEPFAPTFWITREQMLLSMNLAIELLLRL